MTMSILQRCNYFTSISIARSFNDFNYSLLRIISRSSQSHMVYIIGVPKNLVQFIGKHLCWSVFFNKLQAWGKQLYQKRDFGTGVFLWILWNFFRNTFFTEVFKTTCLLWVRGKNCFFFPSVFSFLSSLSCQISIRTECNYVFFVGQHMRTRTASYK